MRDARPLSQPAPALQSPGRDFPAAGELNLIQMGEGHFDLLQVLSNPCGDEYDAVFSMTPDACENFSVPSVARWHVHVDRIGLWPADP
jgi:hypothetical protein